MYIPIEEIHKDSRIWMYISDKPIPGELINFVHKELHNFVVQWTAHKEDLLASYQILYNQIIVLAVDESANSSSGCSIDGSVHFIKKIQHQLGVDFFNRMLIPFVIENNSIQLIHMKEIESSIQDGRLTTDSITINPASTTLRMFEENGLIKLSDSWLYNTMKSSTASGTL